MHQPGDSVVYYNLSQVLVVQNVRVDERACVKVVKKKCKCNRHVCTRLILVALYCSLNIFLNIKDVKLLKTV